MTNNNEIIFDSGCGISEEEQRNILAQINGIAEKNRLSLSTAADSGGKGKKKRRFKAKKSGGLFPVLVNVAAVMALAGGFFVLHAFQGKTDAHVREGAKVYNTAERALIEEIRKETSSRLEDKENEISLISSQLEGVDAELRELLSNNQELNAEQKAAESRLKSMQEEYRAALSSLQDERSRILEEARMREASLQAQLENRTRELALVSEQSAAAVDIAQGEMERLSREQAQAAAVEAQMGALFASLNGKINENRLDEAADIIKTMRGFLGTPAFQGLRSIQARKELYTQAINSFETMIEEARRNQAALATGIMPTDDATEKLLTDFQALQERNARLQRDIAEKDKTLASLNSGSSGMERRINELQRESTEKDERIQAMQTTTNALNQTITNRENTITAREKTITSVQEVLQGKALADMSFNELNEALARINEALRNQ